MRGIVAKLATFALLAGCGLARTGLLAGGGPSGAPDAATPPPPPIGPGDASSLVGDDAGLPGDDAGSASDAVVVTVVDASDAAEDSCPPPSSDAAVSVVTATSTAPTIDGDLSDWGCGPWTLLSQENAAYARQSGQDVSAQFALRWDSAGLYFGAHVVVPTVRGDDPANPYNNDAVEIYLSGDSPLTGDYDPASHQFIVDWKNLAVDYGPLYYPPGKPAPNPPQFQWKAKTVADGWQVEVAISWPALLSGKAPASGGSIGFDLQLDDGDGTALDTQVLAGLAPHAAACGCKACCCGKSPDFPNCDTLTFGRVTLE
jgi:hypothetical protein